jgi:hypothetical protein
MNTPLTDFNLANHFSIIMDNLIPSMFFNKEVEYSGPGLLTRQHSPSQTGSGNGLITSQGGLFTSPGAPGMLTNQEGGPGMLTNQEGGPGMLTNQEGGPGMLTNQEGGPGMLTSQGDPGMLTSTSSYGVDAMLPSPSQPGPGHVYPYNMKDGVEVVIIGRELASCYLIFKVFMMIVFSG